MLTRTTTSNVCNIIIMSCSVAVPNSFFYNKNSIVSSSSPEPLTLSLPLLNPPSTTTSSCSSPSSPSSPFRFVLPNPPTGFSGSASSPSSSVLNRKRPARLDIPVSSINTGVTAAPQLVAAETEVVEVEGRGFSVFCKKGRRKHMEDRYSAAVDLHGEPKQVTKIALLLI